MLIQYPSTVTINEVGPRDGLQNEELFLATADKVSWINQLSLSGIPYIEMTSFVNPNWIPALSDAEEVVKQVDRKPDITYGALVPNLRGLERALAVNIDEVAVFMSATESHNLKNINKTIEQTLPILTETAKEAIASGKTVRGYISTVFGCPYEGKVPIEQVIRVSESLFEMGIRELSLGDTIGAANPAQVQKVLEVLLKRFPSEQLAMHFHNTRGTAMANVLASLDMGITKFDSAVGGLGGCPYAPGASGNLATDDLVYMLEEMGIATNIQRDQLLSAAQFIQTKLQKKLPSHTLQICSNN